MFVSIRKSLTPPIFPEDDNKTLIAQLLMNITSLLMAVTVVFGLILTIPQPARYAVNFPTIFLTTLFCLTLLHFIRRGSVQGAALALVLYLYLVVTFLIWPTGAGGRTASMYFMLIVIAGVLMGRRSALFITGLTMISLWGMYYAEKVGWYMPEPDAVVGILDLVLFSFNLGIIALLLRIATKNLGEAITRAQRNEKELRIANQELNVLRTSLEERVSDRTRALATSAEISRDLSTILDPNQLILQVVEQVKTAFNYYHAHVYFLSEDEKTLKMVGGTGEAGRVLLARGHSISIDRGLVGRVARTKSPVLVQDTSNEAEWLPNPLLPETKSEIAVPIKIGDQVLGVLDVQHHFINGLSQDDVDLLQSIANQVAVAIQNARRFEQSRLQEEALRESQELFRTILETAPAPFLMSNISDGKVLYANEQLGKMLLLPTADLVGSQTPDFYFHPSDRTTLLEKVQQEGSVKDYELYIKKSDGTPFWVSVSIQPILLANSPALLTAFYDLTERKTAEENLAKRAERDRVLNRISTKIRGAISVEQVLAIATQEVRQAVGASRSVVLIEPDEETISLQVIATPNVS